VVVVAGFVEVVSFLAVVILVIGAEVPGGCEDHTHGGGPNLCNPFWLDVYLDRDLHSIGTPAIHQRRVA